MGQKTQLSPWNGVVAGTGAAVMANILVYPLDVYAMALFMTYVLSMLTRAAE